MERGGKVGKMTQKGKKQETNLDNPLNETTA